MREFTVEIKALTPIWTGDVEGKNSRLRETGIIGSLRWWYEAVVRGLEGYACDPTDKDTRCKLDINKYQKSKRTGKSTQQALTEQNICLTCQLFGCTGWARKFRFEAELDQTIPEIWIGTRKKHGRNNRYLKRNVNGLMSNDIINLRIIPLREINKNEWILLNKTIKLIEENGALGAHTSQGNGVIKIVNSNLPYNNEYQVESLKKNNNNVNHPSLDKFFFHKYQLQFNKNLSQLVNDHVFWTHDNSDNRFHDNWNNWNTLWNEYSFLPISFHIRDAIRHIIQNRNDRHDTFGEGGRNAKGSKVFVSHGYKIEENKVEIRVFGYNINDDIINQINKKIEHISNYLFNNNTNQLNHSKIIFNKNGKEILDNFFKVNEEGVK